MRTNSDILLQMLSEAGVDTVFTCPGTTEVPILDASITRELPRICLATHENTAVAAADGYARASGRIGAALLHANVGLANGLAMMEAAKKGRSEVLVLNGTKPVANRNRRGFTQTNDSVSVAAPFVRHASSVSTSESFTSDLAASLDRIQRVPAGPVYLELPQDLLSASSSGAKVPRFSQFHTGAVSDSMDEIASMLSQSGRVMLVAGSDLARGGLEAFLEIARHLDAPIFEAPWRELERSTVPTRLDRYAGIVSYVADLIAGSTVVVVGTPAFQEPDDGPGLLDGAANVVHVVDAFEDSIAGAQVAVGDIGGTLEQLLRSLRDYPSSSVTDFRKQAVARFRQAREELLGTVSSEELSVVNVATALAQLVGDDAVVVDAVTASAALYQLIPRGPEQDFFATGSGALGWGPGAAVGVALSRKYERVYAVVSDGVLQFGLPALHTASREGVPVTYVVLNNGAYNAVSLALKRFGGRAAAAGVFPGTELGDTDFATIAQGFGLQSRRASTQDELEVALAESRDVEGPFLIDVRVSRSGAKNPMR